MARRTKGSESVNVVENANATIDASEAAQVFTEATSPVEPVATVAVQTPARPSLAGLQQRKEVSPDSVIRVVRERWRAWLLGRVEADPEINTDALSNGGEPDAWIRAVYAAANGGRYVVANWAHPKVKGARVVAPCWWRARRLLREAVTGYGAGVVREVCQAVMNYDSQRVCFSRPIDSDGAPVVGSAWETAVGATLPSQDHRECLRYLAEVEEWLLADWRFTPPASFTIPSHPALLRLPADLLNYLS